MALTQKNRTFQIATPLGDDVLLFYRMNGSEELGNLFKFEVELLSENNAVDPSKLLGQNVTIGYALQDGTTIRYFNGYVTRFSQHPDIDGLAYYTATIHPWLWFLTRNGNCRIFQNQTVPDIIGQVFRDQQFTDFKKKLSGTYASRKYCVQYRESDFNFVSRLMEEEGIYYFFTHENGKHTLVLADSPSAHDKYPGYETIPFHTEQGASDRSRVDHIHTWEWGQSIQTGAYALTDYDFKTPRKDLGVKSSISKPSVPHTGYERFDYPGGYTDSGVGESFVRARLEQEGSNFERCHGEGNARGLSIGSLFTLKDHPRTDQNRQYLVLAINYYLRQDAYLSARQSSGGESTPFECMFTASNHSQSFRPARVTPKPKVHGAQTAFVTGPSGEEIYTDKYGRVKVQFHWDRYGEMNENSSCWVRVATPLAGKNWGMISLPRIGQEVVVEFLEGDPDQPLITGSVYNNLQTPPYPLPANMTRSTLKTYSSKGGDGFNELRFEDKKGKEQVFIHAEKDHDIRVKNDSKEWIGKNRHLIVTKDQFEQVDGNLHSTVGGNRNEKVDGTVSLKTAKDLQVKVGMKHAVDAGQEIHLKAGMNVVIEAGMSVTLKAGGGFIVVGPAGVTISGTPVLINSGGSAGSGSGCSPEAPQKPEKADDDKAGGMESMPKPRPPVPKTYGPSSTVLKMAAKAGAPFCQKCAEAAAAAAAGRA